MKVVEVAVLAALSLVLARTGAAQELGPGVEKIQSCVEKNLPKSGRQRVLLERTLRSGSKRSLEATAYWKGDDQDHMRFLVRIEAPPDERGSAFLLIERDEGQDIFTYLPELRTVRRISGATVSGSFFGTDFSYEDVLELQSQSEHARVEKLPDAEVDGRPVSVLSATPKEDADSSYSKVVSFVDRETCVVLRVELYDKSGTLTREVKVDWADVQKDGDRWIPRKIALEDKGKGSISTLSFERGEWDAEVPDRLFNQSELAKGR